MKEVLGSVNFAGAWSVERHKRSEGAGCSNVGEPPGRVVNPKPLVQVLVGCWSSGRAQAIGVRVSHGYRWQTAVFSRSRPAAL